ncbi:Zn-dependent amino-or carboxypeptidase, M28 family [Halovenus aranensis]|uniref:Carboxypeptidase Q n=1 Tax=Halovenus aranensis TaxID=890420 RepID=A0A1G8WJS8_9EURY|nr:M28 family peptidase [Halovenus aranensis]SDJ78376.1 Zn-dependent amino-or carboxypeptidase, M28 family [Halovenus aranensis]
MRKLPNSVVGDAQTSDFGWEVLTDLVDVGNRMAGQEGEAEGAAVVRDAFERAGLREPAIERFDIPGWWREEATLTVETPRERVHESTHEVISLPGSPSGTVTAEVVDVGPGGYDDFEAADIDGAVVMASSETPDSAERWIHRMEKYSNAATEGAAAFVFRNHIDGALPPTGEVGYGNRPGPIPAVGVSSEVGQRLARYAEEGTTVTVDSQCRNEPATSRNVAARLGPEDGEAVLVTAHVDAHDISDGALDNGTGSALVAEIGRLLTSIEDDLDHPVRFVTFGSEEIGLRGAYHWAETRDLDDVKCVVNIDGAGSSRNLWVGTNGFDALGEVFEDVAETFDAPLSTRSTISPHGDQWAFVQEGVPAVMAGSVSESSGRGWGHTHADTLDKLDSRDLRDLSVLLAEGVARLADEDVTVETRARNDIRETIDDGYVQELKTGGRWPY